MRFASIAKTACCLLTVIESRIISAFVWLIPSSTFRSFLWKLYLLSSQLLTVSQTIQSLGSVTIYNTRGCSILHTHYWLIHFCQCVGVLIISTLKWGGTSTPWFRSERWMQCKLNVHTCTLMEKPLASRRRDIANTTPTTFSQRQIKILCRSWPRRNFVACLVQMLKWLRRNVVAVLVLIFFLLMTKHAVKDNRGDRYTLPYEEIFDIS